MLETDLEHRRVEVASEFSLSFIWLNGQLLGPTLCTMMDTQ